MQLAGACYFCAYLRTWTRLCFSTPGDEESGSGSGSGFTTEPEVVHTEPPMLEADKSDPQPPTDMAAHQQKPLLQLLVAVTALTWLLLWLR